MLRPYYLLCRVLHAHVILNPAAGRGAARRVESIVARAFRAQGWAVDVVRTEGPGHAQVLAAQAVRQGAKHVVAVGGDGTVHEVANGLLGGNTDADRKSTRLNSSHTVISYAVFCLKKKNI